MSSFKPTGNGPKYGNFNFSPKTGYSASSGKVQLIKPYTRKVGKRQKVLAPIDPQTMGALAKIRQK